MKTALSLGILLLFAGCSSVIERTDIPLSYPCTAQAPCIAKTLQSVRLLILGQMDSCGGMFIIDSQKVTGRTTDITTKCNQCMREHHFYFEYASDPSDGETLLPAFQHAQDLVHAGQTIDAIPWLQDIIQEDPLFVGAYLLLADSYLSSGDLQKTTEILARVQGLTTSHPGIYRIKAELAIASGDVEAYEEYLSMYSKLFKLQKYDQD